MARRVVKRRPSACFGNDDDLAPLIGVGAPEPTLYEREPSSRLLLVDSHGNEYWEVDEPAFIGFRPPFED